MATKTRRTRRTKNERKAKSENGFAGISEERKTELLGYAGKSGIALKATTVKAGGVYPIRFEEKGTSVLTRAVFALSTKAGETKVSAKSFGAALDSLRKDSERIGKLPFPKGYANLKTVSTRLLSEIRAGRISAVSIPEEKGAVADIASFRKLLA